MDDPIELDDAETRLARAAEAGRLCDFSEDRYVPAIRASTIRALLLSLPVRLAGEAAPRVVDILGPGLRLRKLDDQQTGLGLLQARIIGDLDLDHACLPDGAPAPHLALLGCTFDGEIHLSYAHLRGVSLAGSRLTRICGRHATIDGEIDLSGIRTSQSLQEATGAHGKGLCWIDLHGARIKSTFHAIGAKLVVPKARSKAELEREAPRYALELGQARIEGSVLLSNGFEAIGGVSFNLAQIDGDIKARGSLFKEGESAAFFAADCNVAGSVILSSIEAGTGTELTRVLGTVSLYAARIRGSLLLIGGRVGSVIATNAEINGDVYLTQYNGKLRGQSQSFSFVANGPVTFYAAKIGGEFNAFGAFVKGMCNLAYLSIGGQAGFDAIKGWHRGESHTYPFRCRDLVSLYGANIASNLVMSGAQITGTFNAVLITVGGSAFLSALQGQSAGKAHTILFRCEAFIINGGKISANLSLFGAQIGGEMNAPGLEVQELSIRYAKGTIHGIDTVFPFQIGGTINLYGGKVSRNLYITGGTIEGDVEGRNLRVGADLFIRTGLAIVSSETLPINCRVAGSLRLGSAHIGGDLNIWGVQITGRTNEEDKLLGGDLQADSMTIEGNLSLVARRSSDIQPEIEVATSVSGWLTFQASHIGGRCTVCAGSVGTLNFFGTTVSGAARFYGAKPAANVSENATIFEVKNKTYFGTATFENLLSVENVVFGGEVSSYLMVVRGDFTFRPHSLGGTTELASMKIEKTFTFDCKNVVGTDPIEIDFSNSSVALLNDDGGAGVPENVLLRLEGFSYDRIEARNASAPKALIRTSAWKNRVRWLRKQYPLGKPQQALYRPSPYLHLVKVFNAEGAYYQARKILSEKLRLDCMAEPFLLKRWVVMLFGFFFDFGLSSSHALVVFVACLGIGTAGIALADRGIPTFEVTPPKVFLKPGTTHWEITGMAPVMVIDTGTVDTGNKQKDTAAKSRLIISPGEKACGNTIQPYLYAIDQFIPALDLHQESRCRVTTADEGWLWRLMGMLYSLLGWIVTSLTVLTLTGVLRRYEETG